MVQSAANIAPVPAGSSAFHEQINALPTDQLLAAYQGQRNPFNTKNKLSGGGQSDIAGILKARGVDLSGVTVTPGGVVHHAGLRGIGEHLAPILKIAAPIAALAIPGLGPIAAAALAAGGNEVGNVLQGKNALRSLPGALKTGALTGVGKFALGKLGYGGGGSATSPSGSLASIGNAGTAAGGGGGIGGTLQGIGQGLGIIGQNGQLNPLRLAQLGLGAAGVIQGAQAQGKANQALGRAVAPVNVPMPNLSPIFADPSNPYANQGGQNNAQLAAIRSLQAR